MLGAALIVLLMLVTVVRARAVQDWYHTVTVQGRVTMWLLDDRAKVNGLLLEGGQQIRISPRLADAVVARAHTGDTVSAVGRSGSRSSFGQVVHASTLTINGQTLTVFEEPHPGPRGPHGPGRGDGPPPPPAHEAGRGQVPPPPSPPAAAADGALAPPPSPRPAGADALPPPPAPAAPAVDRNAGPDPAAALAPPDSARGPVSPDAPPPPPPPARGPHRVTVHGKVQAFLVGERGEVVGLALDSGEQVRVPPPVGGQLTGGSTDPHPDVVVEGDAVQGEQGTIIRLTQVTIGTRTLIVQ